LVPLGFGFNGFRSMHVGFWFLLLLVLKVERLRIAEKSPIQPTRCYDAETRFLLILFLLDG
jgi:hypothetical protein